MDAISNQRIVELYFKAWQDFDTNLLREIFSDDAKYIIENKDRCLDGIDEIVKYWLRNKGRQHNLNLEWNMDLDCNTSFRAHFWDSEEGEDQEIVGIIHFLFDRDRRIKQLKEHYQKIIHPNFKRETR